MERYGWLQKKHQKALKVFENAKADLSRVVNAIEHELGQAHTRISTMKAAINSEEAGIAFLESHKASVEKQTAKIAAILE